MEKHISRSKTRLYYVWQGMKRRCDSPKNKSYADYGARGIKVCDQWANDYGAFMDWALANGYKQGLSIDRIDNDKGYSPDNCRWVGRKQQNENRRSVVRLTAGGETRTMADWENALGLPPGTVGRWNRERGASYAEKCIEETLEGGYRNRHLVDIEVDGMSKSMAEWSRASGIEYDTLRGWKDRHGKVYAAARIREALGNAE
jgi:hypothetical protein